VPSLRPRFAACVATSAFVLALVPIPVAAGQSAALGPGQQAERFERPAADARGSAARTDPGMPAAPLIGLGVLSLCGLAAVAALVERLKRERRTPAPATVEAVHDAIEAELQAMIIDAKRSRELRARAP
jgi:hypothetical protein